MTTLREAAQQALEALEDAARCVQENYLPDQFGHDWDEQITALRAALAQQAEPLSPDAIAHTQTAWKMGYEARKAEEAEPVQEPDSPERRCGGPGCDMTCCQPVQEPVALVRTWHKGEEQHAELLDWGIGVDALPDGEHTLYTAPPQREPLTSDKDRPDQGATYVEGYGYVDTRAVRAIERAHGIGEQDGR